MEKLRAYIREVMHQKNLRAIDIEAQSDGNITDSYISDILSGKTKNISVDKVNALAQGMGMSSIEVFKMASGDNLQEENDEWSKVDILKTIGALLYDPGLARIAIALVNADPAKIKAIQKILAKK